MNGCKTLINLSSSIGLNSNKYIHLLTRRISLWHYLYFPDEKNPPTPRTMYFDQPQQDSYSSWEEIEEPTSCCMSGCANCVWIEYAEKVSRVLNESGEDVQKIIMEKVQDPNMRAFLSMELRCRNLVKS